LTTIEGKENMSFPITPKLIDHTTFGPVTKISSSSLGTGLIQDQPGTLALIQQFESTVSADQISIDSAGYIIIDNPRLANWVDNEKANTAAWIKNGICGKGC